VIDITPRSIRERLHRDPLTQPSRGHSLDVPAVRPRGALDDLAGDEQQQPCGALQLVRLEEDQACGQRASTTRPQPGGPERGVELQQHLDVWVRGRRDERQRLGQAGGDGLGELDRELVVCEQVAEA
jgi:hypothetical protein